jgi:hypothetical protein
MIINNPQKVPYRCALDFNTPLGQEIALIVYVSNFTDINPLGRIAYSTNHVVDKVPHRSLCI